jgi:membrane protease YdiL (CAAX protease family)
VLLVWLIARGICTIILVPLIEELFFRGYLERRLHLSVSRAAVIVAAISGAIFFVILHGRWAEVFFANLLFSWVAARRGNLTDSVLAHGVANALIFGAAIVAGDMSIL